MKLCRTHIARPSREIFEEQMKEFLRRVSWEKNVATVIIGTRANLAPFEEIEKKAGISRG